MKNVKININKAYTNKRL